MNKLFDVWLRGLNKPVKERLTHEQAITFVLNDCPDNWNENHSLDLYEIVETPMVVEWPDGTWCFKDEFNYERDWAWKSDDYITTSYDESKHN